MASSYSTDLKLELMVTGENAGTWGDKTNTNLNLIQQAIAGFQAVSIAGGAQTTALVMSNASISNARNAVVKLTGTITGNQIVTIPDGIEKTYIVENGTTGAFTVEFKTVSGTGPTFSTTDKGIKIVYSDGTNVVDVNANLSGPTLASDLNVNGKSIISTSNGNIVLAPNGTGDIQLDADTVRIGDSNTDAVLTTNGTGDITISTNSGTNSGTVKIFDGVDGNIEITPNGTGVVKLDGLSYPTADGTSGQVLQTNGSGILSFATISAGTPTVNTFDTGTAATYTKPGTANWMLVELWGGGGSGGRSTANAGSGGGGGGSYNYAMLPFADLVGDVTYTVGSGGAGRTANNSVGNIGGTTSVSFANFQGLGTTKTISAFGGGGGGARGIAGFGSGAGGGTQTANGGSGGGGGGQSTVNGGNTDIGSGSSGGVPASMGGGGGVQYVPSCACTPAQTNLIRAAGSIFGGGGGGGALTTTGGAGGNSYYGGGGGSGSRTNTGGISIWGGNGSNGAANAVATADGSLPAGGSAGSANANSGNGGGGRVRFTYW